MSTINILPSVTEVRESNNPYWVTFHLKVGWTLLSVFHSEKDGVEYVIGWQREDKKPVEPDLNKAVEEYCQKATSLVQMISDADKTKQWRDSR